MSQARNAAIFRCIISRCEANGYKGKKADSMAIEMLCGALSALTTVPGLEQDYQHLEAVAFYIIAPRGLAEMRRMVETFDAKPKDELEAGYKALAEA